MFELFYSLCFEKRTVNATSKLGIVVGKKMCCFVYILFPLTREIEAAGIYWTRFFPSDERKKLTEAFVMHIKY